MQKVIAIAGAGFAGAVLARELAASKKYKIIVFDERSHVAGNCHTARDKNTDVLVHEYGPHIFHTDRADVWNYINRFGSFSSYVNRVKATTAAGVFSLPINLLTLNQFFRKKMSPREAEQFLASQGDKTIREARNFEERALQLLGKDLYENFFYGYTKKQWGVEPTELPASILQRLPIRFSYDDNYYTSRYQGIPLDGYTPIVASLLDHPAIEIRLGERINRSEKSRFHHLFYSGPLDGYFSHLYGRLQYRTLKFERFEGVGDYQGNPVMNYCEEGVPYTRITEHKHFMPWEKHERSDCFREFSKATAPGDVPYYPLRLAADKALLQKYIHLGNKEEGVTFLGRLGTYRYLDMHMVIAESLDLAQRCLARPEKEWDHFSADPLPAPKPFAQKVAA